MSTSSVQSIIKDTIGLPIGLNKNIKPNSTIGLSNRMQPTVVDMLLQDYADLIETKYTPWFAKRFYDMPFDVIHRCASEARADGKNPQRLFAFLIKKVNIDSH